MLAQTVQRPAVENIRAIEAPKGSTSKSSRSDGSSVGAISLGTGRSPPPRGAVVTGPQEFDPSSDSNPVSVSSRSAPKFNMAPRPGGTRKAGAIEMFAPADSQEPAEKKQMTRAPRPLPPTVHPAGIPLDQPGPPTTRPYGESRIIPPPNRPAPNRNRAPPREAPDTGVPKAVPPSMDSPKPAMKIQPKEPKKKRRDRDMPEFEESSSDEESSKPIDSPVARTARSVRTDPSPEGPPGKKKQGAWGDPVQSDVATPVPSAMSVGVKSMFDSDKSSFKPDSNKIRPSTAGGPMDPRSTVQETNVPTTDVKKKSAAPLVAKGAWGDSFAQEEDVDDKRGIKPLKLKFPVESNVRSDNGFMPPSDSDRPNTASGPEDESYPEAVTSPMNSKIVVQGTGVSARTKNNMFSSVLTGVNTIQTQEDILFSKTLPRGRLSITCLKGYDMERDPSTSKGVSNSRLDPYIKFRVGKADKNPSKTTKVQRRQDDNPDFENELICFDILDPKEFVLNQDLQLIVEVWNKVSYEMELNCWFE